MLLKLNNFIYEYKCEILISESYTCVCVCYSVYCLLESLTYVIILDSIDKTTENFHT
jgi:hypothetical protein